MRCSASFVRSRISRGTTKRFPSRTSSSRSAAIPGDAYYWRAANELEMDRLDAAWTDIEAADKAMVNSDVPKLAGIIEMRRKRAGRGAPEARDGPPAQSQ